MNGTSLDQLREQESTGLDGMNGQRSGIHMPNGMSPHNADIDGGNYSQLQPDQISSHPRYAQQPQYPPLQPQQYQPQLPQQMPPPQQQQYIPSQPQPPQQNPNQMKDLINDINNGLDDISSIDTLNFINDKYAASDDYDEKQNRKKKKSDKDKTNDKDDKHTLWLKIPEFFREPLVIICVYVFFVHPTIQSNITKHLKQITTDPTGKISLLGTIIYGTIIAILYVIVKMFLQKY
jgi:hypothetical protein